MSTQSEPTWGTAQGKQIPYRDLTDDHLTNVINDGYRNPYLVIEAERRGVLVPERPIDRLSPVDLLKESMMYVEACASCAIEGNGYGDMICKAWENDKGLFYHYLNQHLENLDREEADSAIRLTSEGHKVDNEEDDW